MLFQRYAFYLASLVLVALFSSCLQAESAAQQRSTENVILITIDGLRWQEVFSGADESLINRKFGGVRDEATHRHRFWRATAEERRQALMPFFWKVVQPQGVVFGDPEQKSSVLVTNPHVFSYPGYNEMLTGYGDPEIDSNAKLVNQNVTVLEWLNQRDTFRGRVSVFASWDAFPFILNTERSEIPVNAGWQPLGEKSELLTNLDSIADEMPHTWNDLRYDYFTFQGALESLKTDQPRVLYVAFGESDNWAHEKRYDLYLDATRRADTYIEQLWTTLQKIPQYAGKTTLVITTDHGRGSSQTSWRHHRYDVPGSNQMWLALLGPDIPHSVPGESTVTQSQVAATVAALLGEDFHKDAPGSAPPLKLSTR